MAIQWGNWVQLAPRHVGCGPTAGRPRARTASNMCRPRQTRAGLSLAQARPPSQKARPAAAVESRIHPPPLAFWFSSVLSAVAVSSAPLSALAGDAVVVPIQTGPIPGLASVKGRHPRGPCSCAVRVIRRPARRAARPVPGSARRIGAARRTRGARCSRAAARGPRIACRPRTAESLRRRGRPLGILGCLLRIVQLRLARVPLARQGRNLRGELGNALRVGFLRLNLLLQRRFFIAKIFQLLPSRVQILLNGRRTGLELSELRRIGDVALGMNPIPE